MDILDPKKSGKFISKNAKNVFIEESGIKKLAHEIAEGVKKKDISIFKFSKHELHPQKADEATVGWLFFVNTLNFCFWSADEDHKCWEVSWNGKTYTGYSALCAAIKKALENGIPITSPKFYSRVTAEQLEKILQSDSPNTKVTLLGDRVACLHQIGNKLIEKYKGTFVTCIKKCNNSAQSLLKLIVQEFPCFRDEAVFHGQKVAIYRRAQILIRDIWVCFRGMDLGRFTDIHNITMFADYRIPQVMIHYGALKYSDELMALLKSNTLLENGSENEVEIRGCSIEVVEQIRDEVVEIFQYDKYSSVNSILIDHFLWDYRRKHAEALESIPFHKTLSIYY